MGEKGEGSGGTGEGTGNGVPPCPPPQCMFCKQEQNNQILSEFIAKLSV